MFYLNTYKKNYVTDEKGMILLENPETALQDITNVCKKIFENIDSTEILRDIKVKILCDFKEIYEFDQNNSNYPEPSGVFESDEERINFIRKTILIQDISLYLGNIFGTYHKYIIENKKAIPIMDVPAFIINYNDIYIRAIDEYFLVLLGGNYPRYVLQYINYQSNTSNRFINIINGKIGELPINKVSNDTLRPIVNQYAYGTTYMLPVLIEKSLLTNIKTKLFHTCMDRWKELVEHEIINLTEEEKTLYNIFSKKGDKLLNGNPEKKLYEIFIKYHIIDENDDYKMILTGKSNNNKKLTLGSIFYSDYVKSVIKTGYLNLLGYLFDTKNLNLRNLIMHGDNLGYNYFEIVLSSIMVQLLWDIWSHDIFIDNII